MSHTVHPGAAHDLTEAFRFHKAEADKAVAARFLAA